MRDRPERRLRAAVAALTLACVSVIGSVGWVMSRYSRTGELELLAPAPADENHWGPDWSPDGRTIAFASGADGDFEIYLLDVQTSAVVQLTHNDANDWRPDWSPDGEQLVFTSDRTGNLEVWVMDRSGKGARQVTETESAEDRVRFSPDGLRIAFDSDRSGSWGVYVMDWDGANTQTVVDGPGFDAYPAWSPDGEALVFTSNLHAPDGGSAQHELYTVRPDGTDLRRVTFSEGNDQAAAWSPNGDWIAFFSSRDGNPEIYLIRPDGTEGRRLTSNDEWDFMPAWSPDGTKLALDSRRDGHRAIWTMRLDGSEAERRTDPAVSEFFRLVDGGAVDSALARLDASLAVDPETRFVHPEELFFLGRRLLGEGHVDVGLELLRTVVRLDPEHVRGWVVLAEALEDLDRVDEARRAFEAALALDEANHRAAAGRGRLPG